MPRDLTNKQGKFASEYIETGNATEAANRAYKPKNRNTAHAIGAENLRKPTIREYLEAKAHAASSMIYKLSQRAKSESVRLNASKDILDRAGYAAKYAEQQARPVEIYITEKQAERILERSAERLAEENPA